MSFPAAALDLEMKAIGPNGAPTLGAAYGLLQTHWNDGSRDRELLHLLFLAWYSMVEPPYLTGFESGAVSKERFGEIARSVFDTLLPSLDESRDAEVLFIVGVMSQVAPWVFGGEATWDARSRVCRSRYRELAPQGIEPKVFEGRGAFGDYFRQWVTRGGF